MDYPGWVDVLIAVCFVCMLFILIFRPFSDRSDDYLMIYRDPSDPDIIDVTYEEVE